MKKLFIALMAVLVLASCGKKKEVVETPGDVATIMAACANEVADKIEKADNAEQVVEAFEQYANGLLDMYSNNKELFNALDEMDEEQLLQSYPEPMAELAKAEERLEAVSKKIWETEFSEEQQNRLMDILVRLSEVE
ncbi:MAG: hypothetical protein IIV89_00385 [Bacteroidaceae bacterium]|nr:hypothetical protein [Bacteroidaceae bacterium]